MLVGLEKKCLWEMAGTRKEGCKGNMLMFRESIRSPPGDSVSFISNNFFCT